MFHCLFQQPYQATDNVFYMTWFKYIHKNYTIFKLVDRFSKHGTINLKRFKLKDLKDFYKIILVESPCLMMFL